MIIRFVRVGLLVVTVAIVAMGCRGCMRENIVWEHSFNRPDQRGLRNGPREYPEFEVPPGGRATGAYHSTSYGDGTGSYK